MVAEFVVHRQSGSPINGETACLNGSVPATHTMTHGGAHGAPHSGPHDAHKPLTVPLTHPGHHGGPPAVIQQQHQHQAQQQQQPPPPPPPHHHHHHQAQQQQQQQQQHHHHDGPQVTTHPDNMQPNFEIRKELFSQRKQREFIPDNKKDDSYWDRRRRNNEAAKRSREKRRFNDMVLEQRVMELSKENHILKAQLDAIRDKFGICGETIINTEHVLAAMPTEPIVKRAKLPASALLYARTPSPVHTSVIHQPVNGARSPRSPASQLYVPETTASTYPETESFQYPYSHHPAIHHLDTTSALNLSSRARRAQSPFELSSGSGDEAGSQIVVSSQNNAASNNSLPHKLRHKSRIGDKDAASALLALQGIKQEPGPRASPPWDNGEGSSDERDSGISLGVEWTGPSVPTISETGRDMKLKLDRIASEVASLQMILGQPAATDSLVTGRSVATVSGP